MSTTIDGPANDLPGYICPFCNADCSPISGEACMHLFAVDGENGWRFTEVSRPIFEAAAKKEATLFRDLLYHDPRCRLHLRLRRANYDDSLEMYVFSENPGQTAQAFSEAIEGSSDRQTNA